MSDGFQRLPLRSLTTEEVAPPPLAGAETSGAMRWALPEIVGGGGRPRSGEPLASADVGGGSQASETQQQLDALREQARQEGFAQGEAEARRLLGEQSQQLQLLVAALREPMSWLEDSLKEQLTGLACTLAKVLLGRELSLQPELLRDTVQRAVDLLPAVQGGLEIALNPDDVATLRGLAETDGEPLEPGWRILEDSDVSRGGCLIKTRISQIDRRLETRLQNLLNDTLSGLDAGCG